MVARIGTSPQEVKAAEESATRMRRLRTTVAASEEAREAEVQPELDFTADEAQEGESEQEAGDRIIEKYRAQATSPTKAIRAMCVYCMNGQPREVAKCTAPKCPLFPFRMGRNPFHGRAVKKEGDPE